MYLPKLSQASQGIFHGSIIKTLNKLGFVEFTPTERVEENKKLKLTPTKKLRQEDASNCSTWRKTFATGYMIEVILRFHKTKRIFLKTGKIGVQIKSITNMQEQLVYLTFAKEQKSKPKITATCRFLIKVLENIPQDRSDNPMKLSKRDKKSWNYCFVSELPRTKPVLLFSENFFNLLSEEDRQIMKDISRNREDYIDGKPEDVEYIGDTLHKRKANNKSVVISHNS